MSKSMLVERLREAEDRLLTARQEETMATLVQTKIKLAQADYVNLELQVGSSPFLAAPDWRYSYIDGPWQCNANICLKKYGCPLR
jgi:hypothetical protein